MSHATATHEPLFLKAPDANALFSKEASISRMPDDERKWPAHTLSEIHKQLPFISAYDVDISLSRVEAEQGFALGYAMLRNKSQRQVAMEEIGKPQNRIRIPLIITDRQLQPFHVFELGGACYPLTKERIEAAMLNPEMFDGSVTHTPGSPSLVDNMFPPYQQRGGFGRMSAGTGASGFGGGSSSSSKTGSAPDSWEGLFVKEGASGDPHRYSAGNGHPAKRGMAGKKGIHKKGEAGTSPESLNGDQDAKVKKNSEQGAPAKGWAAKLKASEVQGDVGARGPGDNSKGVKSASVLSLIAGTLNKGDFARFEDTFKDPTIRPFVEKNAMLQESLGRLLSMPIMEPAELRKIAMDAALNREPTVIQLRPSGYGYTLKYAVAPFGVEPQEMQLTAEQAQQQMPQGMPQAADQQGAATLTQVQAEPDPLVEQTPQPVTTPGLYKVFEAGTGRQLVGFVIPNLIDPIGEMAAQQAAQQQQAQQQQMAMQQQTAQVKQQAAKKPPAPEAGAPAGAEKTPEKKPGGSKAVTANVHAGAKKASAPLTGYLKIPIYDGMPGDKGVKRVDWTYQPVHANEPLFIQDEHVQFIPASKARAMGIKTAEGEAAPPAPSPQMQQQPAPPPPPAIFINGGQYALGSPIYGKLVGVSFDLPSSTNLRGLGVFYKTDGKAMLATVPFQIVSEVQVEGRKFFAAKTQAGQDIQLSLSPGMKKPYAMPSQNPAQPMQQPGPIEVFIPAEWKWVALDNPIQLDQGQGNPMMTVQASAMDSMAEIRAWRGGCSLSGPVFQKVGSGEYDWADGVFWLACTGVHQDLAVQMLEKAAEAGQVVRIYGLQTLSPISDLVKKASISARVDLAALPNLPRRVNLLKEAAVITFDKKAGALVDTASVDNVLSLNFLNPENVATFVENIPQLEETSCKLASLVLATQLGLQSIPKTAAVRAMFALEDVITGLKGLQTYSL